MNCYEFNIGTEEALKEEYQNKNRLNDWWAYLLEEGVITLGFDSEIGDRGTLILRACFKSLNNSNLTGLSKSKQRKVG